MKEYESISEESQAVQYIVKNKLSNMTSLLDKTDSFKNGIILPSKNDCSNIFLIK